VGEALGWRDPPHTAAPETRLGYVVPAAVAGGGVLVVALSALGTAVFESLLATLVVHTPDLLGVG